MSYCFIRAREDERIRKEAEKLKSLEEERKRIEEENRRATELKAKRDAALKYDLDLDVIVTVMNDVMLHEEGVNLSKIKLFLFLFLFSSFILDNEEHKKKIVEELKQPNNKLWKNKNSAPKKKID